MKKISVLSYQLFSLVIGLIVIFPVIYAICVSFMPAEEILSTTVHLFPKRWTIENYVQAFTKAPLLRYLLNSLVMTLGATTVRLFTASTAAFAFSFFEFRGKKFLFLFFIGTMMIPSDLLIIKNYSTVAKLGLVNTYLGMMVVFFVTMVNIFVMRQYFLSYSKSVREAALIDGCTNFMFFRKILIPSSKPVFITTFISSFVGVWNQYLWPLLVTNRNQMRTAQVAVTLLNFPDASPHGLVMAAAIIIVLPSAIIFIIFQRYIKKGMMAGGVKG